MRKNFWIYLALSPVLCATVILYDDAAAYFLGAVLLLLPIWGLLQGAATAPFIRGKFQIPAQMAETGQRIAVSLEFRSRSVLACPNLWAEITVCGGDGRPAAVKKVPVPLPSRGQVEIRTSFTCEYCGLFTVQAERFWVSDDWGFFAFRGKKIPGKTELAVLPAPVPVTMQVGSAARQFCGEAQEFDQMRPGEDISEVFGVHEYLPGDRIQRTHWKLSARTGKWMVKDFSMPWVCPVLILADWKGTEETAESLDWMLRVVMGLSMGLCRQKCFHEILRPGEGGAERTAVRTEEDCYAWGERLIRSVPKEKTDWAAKAGGQGEAYQHIFLVSSRFCPEMDEWAECFWKSGRKSVFVPEKPEGEAVETVYCLPAGKTDEALRELYLEV